MLSCIWVTCYLRTSPKVPGETPSMTPKWRHVLGPFLHVTPGRGHILEGLAFITAHTTTTIAPSPWKDLLRGHILEEKTPTLCHNCHTVANCMIEMYPVSCKSLGTKLVALQPCDVCILHHLFLPLRCLHVSFENLLQQQTISGRLVGALCYVRAEQ